MESDCGGSVTSTTSSHQLPFETKRPLVPIVVPAYQKKQNRTAFLIGLGSNSVRARQLFSPSSSAHTHSSVAQVRPLPGRRRSYLVLVRQSLQDNGAELVAPELVAGEFVAPELAAGEFVAPELAAAEAAPEPEVASAASWTAEDSPSGERAKGGQQGTGSTT